MVAVRQPFESARRVRVSNLDGFGRHAGQCILERRRRALNDDCIKVFGVFSRHCLGKGSAERVAHTYNLGETGMGPYCGYGPQILHEDVGQLDLKGQLNDLEGVWVTGETCSEAVIGEGCVAGRSRGIDVTVTRCDVPVGVVQGPAVSEKLNGGDFLQRCSVGWEAEFEVDAVSARHGPGWPDCACSGFAIDLGALNIQLSNLAIGFGGGCEDLEVGRCYGDLDIVCDAG